MLSTGSWPLQRAPHAQNVCHNHREACAAGVCDTLWGSVCSAGLRKPASTHRTGQQAACTTYRASLTKTGGPLPLIGSPTQCQLALANLTRPGALGCVRLSGAPSRLVWSSSLQSQVGARQSAANTPVVGAQTLWQARLLSWHFGPSACVLVPGSSGQAQQAILRCLQVGGAGRCSQPHQHPLRTLNPSLLSGTALESLQ